MNQVKINFEGNDSEEMREAFWSFLNDSCFIINFKRYVETLTDLEEPEIEVNGNVMKVK